MLDGIKLGSDFIVWLGSISAGLGVLSIFARWIASALDFDDQNVLLGKWYSYGYFHSEEGQQFYREEIDIWRSWFWPWRLVMLATPTSTGDPEKYRGWVKKIGDYVYSCTKQGFRDDICFEIGKLRLSEDNIRDKVVVIHLGGSYVSYVHSATSFLWSRKKLDPNAVITSTSASEIEKGEFLKICHRYFDYRDDIFEFQLKYKPPR